MTRRFQFSLRAILLLMMILSLPLAWQAWRRRVAQERFERIYGRLNALKELGGRVDTHIVSQGEVVTGDGAEASPPWYFIALHMDGSRMTDREMALIEPLTTLKTLELRGTKVTDSGLMHLWGLTALRRLDLRETLVTDAGVTNLQKHLPNCSIDR